MSELTMTREGPRLISDEQLRGEILKMPAYGEESLQFKLIHDLAESRAWAEDTEAKLKEAVELLERYLAYDDNDCFDGKPCPCSTCKQTRAFLEGVKK